MNVNDMRDALKARYSDVIRKQRVDTMPDRQVCAIYHSLVERRDPMTSNVRVTKRNRLHEPVKYEQLRMEI